MEPGLSSKETNLPRGRPALWLGLYGSLGARQQECKQLGAAFAVDDPVDEVRTEAALERNHRFLRVGHVIAEPLEREQEAGVGPIRVDEIASRARQSKAGLGQRWPR